MRASLWLRHARQRDPQRGNTLLLALIVMSALAALGSLTVISVQSSFKASTHDRAQTVALYAAESGAAYAIQYLRENYDYTGNSGWSAFVKPSNDPALVVAWDAAILPESGAQPGSPDNPFTNDQQAWFTVKVLNNRDDPYFELPAPANNDADGRVIVQVTGHGPQGATAIVEWDIQRGRPGTHLGPVTPPVAGAHFATSTAGSGEPWPAAAAVPRVPFPQDPAPFTIHDPTPALESWTWFAPVLAPYLGPPDDRRSPVILRGYRIVNL